MTMSGTWVQLALRVNRVDRRLLGNKNPTTRGVVGFLTSLLTARNGGQ